MRNLIAKFSIGFFRIFREPRDIHRVIISGLLAVFASHTWFLFYEAETKFIFTKDHIVLGILIGAMLGFMLFWSIFSSNLNIKLYVRQIIVIGWAILAHRLSYGVESFGSIFVTAMLFLGWSIWIPFALTGMRFDELQTKIEDWQNAKKNKDLVVHNGYSANNAANG